MLIHFFLGLVFHLLIDILPYFIVRYSVLIAYSILLLVVLILLHSKKNTAYLFALNDFLIFELSLHWNGWYFCYYSMNWFSSLQGLYYWHCCLHVCEHDCLQCESMSFTFSKTFQKKLLAFSKKLNKQIYFRWRCNTVVDYYRELLRCRWRLRHYLLLLLVLLLRKKIISSIEIFINFWNACIKNWQWNRIYSWRWKKHSRRRIVCIEAI